MLERDKPSNISIVAPAETSITLQTQLFNGNCCKKGNVQKKSNKFHLQAVVDAVNDVVSCWGLGRETSFVLLD
jgi:hypothetical protein